MTDTDPRLKSALSDRYTVDRELGRGGMAVVYLAQDQKLDRPVALKVLRPELAASLGADRFLREIQIASKLSHPNILGLFDCGEADGLLYYTMPFVEGETLRERMNREKQLPLEDALEITKEVAGALGYAHEQGLVHRDVKPENILFQGGHAVVADFGIARALSEAGTATLTETGLAVGTPAYMSPEQAAGSSDVDGRADLYSLGCVLYEMLSGDAPYMASTPMAVIAKKLSEPIPHISVVREAVPGSVEAALTKALAKNAADRFKTAEQFADALSVDTAAFERGQRVRRRVQRVGAGAALMLVAVSIGAFYFVQNSPVEASFTYPEILRFTIVSQVEGTASESLREGVKTLLIHHINQSGVLRAVPEDDIHRELRSLDRDTAAVDLSLARALAQPRGIPTVVAPELHQVGSGYLFTIRLVATEDESLILEESGEARDESDLMPTVADVFDAIRIGLGEERATIASAREIQPVFTASLDALLLYQRAYGHGQNSRNQDCIKSAEQAVTIDPEFAQALRVMGNCLHNAGFQDSAQGINGKVLELRHRLPEYEWLYTRSRSVPGDTALAAVQRALQLNPNWHRLYAGYALVLSWEFSRFHDAAEAYSRGRAVSPFALPETHLFNEGNNRIAAGEFEEAEALLNLQTNPNARTLLEWELAVGRRQWDEVERIGAQAPGLMMLSGYGARGRLTDAQEFFETVPASARDFNYDHDRWLIWRVAGEWGREALPRPNPGSITGQLLWAAQAGDSAAVGTLIEDPRRDAEAGYDYDRWFPVMARALLAAQASDHRGVLEVLTPVALSAGGYTRDWLIAEAHSALGQPDSAVTYLERVRSGAGCYERKCIVRSGVLYPFAVFWLGQIYTELGNDEAAAVRYQEFLEVFTRPDPGFQWMVEEARAELARLGG